MTMAFTEPTKEEMMQKQYGAHCTDGIIRNHAPQRERTAREALEAERLACFQRGCAINAKIEALDKEYGKSLLEMPEQAFRQRFSLDIWGPF